MYIVITGGGKVGEFVARKMLREGHSVVVIDSDEATAMRLSENLRGSSLVIHGDGCELSVQEDAGVFKADIFVATTGHDENNLAACEIASRISHVPRCIARVNNPKNLRIFRRLEIECVSSTALIANMIEEEAMVGSMSAAISLTSDNVGLLEVTVPHMKRHDNATGVLLRDVRFDEGIRVVAVRHDAEFEIVGEDTRLLYGDNVIIAADTQLIGRAREIIRSL
jgi:trk system potassium uptake protein TrkA